MKGVRLLAIQKVSVATALVNSMKYISIILTVFLTFTSSAFAQVVDGDDPYGWNERYKAKQVVLNNLSYGNGRYARACREDITPMGCERRVSSLVDSIFTSSLRHEVDPWVMIALAFETTHFNPFYIGNDGFTGIMGVPLEHTFRRHEPFFTNAAYRESCRAELDACQVESIEHSIARVAETMRVHEISPSLALQRYSGMELQSSRAVFSRHVLRRARSFRSEALDIDDFDICQAHPMICD